MEIADKWFAIVNPVAGSGRGLTDWPLISRLLRERHIVPEYVFTERKYHAIELAVEAVNNGFRKIIVVGGDGTIHEVVNGLFIQKTVPTTDVLLSVIAVGTGNDWIRMFGIPRKYSEAIRAIADGHSFLQDVGVISYYKASYKQSRYMANVAGVGFDAFVNRKYNHLKEEGKKGKWLYLWSTLKAVLRYSSTGVKVYVDDELVVNDLVYSATIGIGRYNGGGMLQTPEAVADDGRIYKLRKTSLNRGRRIRIESSPEIAVEVDGEALGYSPFEFEIIDRAVRVVVAERFLSESAGASSGSPAPETNRPSTN